MKYFSYIIILAIIISGIWAIFIEPNILVIKHIKLENASLAGTKIVFASDFHIKPYEGYRLKRVVNAINKQNPDLILLGGDFVNGHKKNFTMPIEDIANGLGNLKAKRGIYSVIGNHDGWQGKYEIIKALEAKGIVVLENKNIDLGNLTIAGVEDMQTAQPDIKKALTGAGKNIILMSHTPDIFPLVPKDVILTISGHLHGGQVVLPGIPPKYVPSRYGVRYLHGLIRENNKTLYSSKGLGNSILPMRFNCPPEFVVIEFKK